MQSKYRCSITGKSLTSLSAFQEYYPQSTLQFVVLLKRFPPPHPIFVRFLQRKMATILFVHLLQKKQSFALGEKGHLKNLSNCIMEISHCILNGSIFLFFFYCLPNTIRLSANYIIEPKNCSKVSNIHTYEFLGRLSNTPLTP